MNAAVRRLPLIALALAFAARAAQPTTLTVQADKAGAQITGDTAAPRDVPRRPPPRG